MSKDDFDWVSEKMKTLRDAISTKYNQENTGNANRQVIVCIMKVIEMFKATLKYSLFNHSNIHITN